MLFSCLFACLFICLFLKQTLCPTWGLNSLPWDQHSHVLLLYWLKQAGTLKQILKNKDCVMDALPVFALSCKKHAHYYSYPNKKKKQQQKLNFYMSPEVLLLCCMGWLHISVFEPWIFVATDYLPSVQL